MPDRAAFAQVFEYPSLVQLHTLRGHTMELTHISISRNDRCISLSLRLALCVRACVRACVWCVCAAMPCAPSPGLVHACSYCYLAGVSPGLMTKQKLVLECVAKSLAPCPCAIWFKCVGRHRKAANVQPNDVFVNLRQDMM